MRAIRLGLAVVVFLACLSPLNGQEAQGQATAKNAEPEVPIKVQIVLTEFDGNQKISSLPYTLDMLGTGQHNQHRAFLRFGVRVPIVTGGVPGGNQQYTYQDVGTNLDCTTIQRDDGEYRLDLGIDRSSVSMPDSKVSGLKAGESILGSQPLIRSFREELTLVIKSGQTIEGTSAVDPVTGHVLKVEVTLTVLK